MTEKEQDPSKVIRTAKQRSYLVIADENEREESLVALYYALNLAELNDGHVSIVHIQDPDSDFMHWGAVENMMKQDMRAASEKLLFQYAKECNAYNGHIPSLHSREGEQVKVINDIIESDPRISALILGANTNSSNAGPLISHFTNKGMAQLNIPVIVVPGNLDIQRIEELI